ncbi:MAG: ATP-binding protein [Saprospiraceae bacterium]|nr:ATP-binding protein [Saprospiraceae bacterium]
MYVRKINLEKYNGLSCFLWGARQTGKSTFLRKNYSESLYIDLLLSQEFRRYLDNPEQFRQRCIANHHNRPIIIDEIQKLPELLNEIHWMIENEGIRFIMSGSSPRKILRKNLNLLGGRAIRSELYPLTFSEIPDFDIIKAFNNGLLPRMYDSSHATVLLDAYIGSYLEDEIIAETKIRNVEVFSRFLTKAAFANGEFLNFTNIAQDCGVASSTIKEYYNILEETMIGSFVPSFQKRPKRRVVLSPKFYFFDVGVANHLLKRKNIEWGTTDVGHSFEHFIYMELRAYAQYSGKKFPINYWHTTSQLEVDFVLGDHECAIEVKATDNVQNKHFKGLLAFSEEYNNVKKMIVSNDPFVRKYNDIMIYPWKDFLEKLWSHEII